MSDIDIEQRLQAAGADAPRLSPEDIDGNIQHVEYVKCITHGGQVLRWAVITTKNGFAVTGRPSASVSPENDRQDIGESVALTNARQELWPLMGYALKERLAAAPAKKMPEIVETEFSHDMMRMCAKAVLHWADNTVTVGLGRTEEDAYRDAWNKKEQENV
jgi:hypothetical protein